ncbi:DUF1992 domain-containing protein [Cereibacter sphaeroides]|uniref:DnaJ family domain-containing protein n=1 Tax=Cereibacter sphaeroides TaxID=1063 RepID=UPI000F52AA42|nr:DUF1992 domain-containing protein [Cereibacter sphaeroides]AZB64624.1 DUF1992 domain-containing protein [Cereibacter sphaeroides]AZB69915.1 DUF1992 domain-containing protein [Cereibacter sphaeroides]
MEVRMGWLDRIAERRMLKARAEGKLSGLSGEGQPLPERPSEAFTSPGEAVGFRIMAEAGVLPEEIVLKKQAAEQRARLAEISDPEERRAAMAELARIEMRQAMAEEARRRFLRG